MTTAIPAGKLKQVGNIFPAFSQSLTGGEKANAHLGDGKETPPLWIGPMPENKKKCVQGKGYLLRKGKGGKPVWDAPVGGQSWEKI